MKTIELQNEDHAWQFLVEYGIAKASELRMVTGIMGFSLDTLNHVLYYQTGYHDIEQYLECEGGEG
jgi:hypothetical protein